MPMTNQALMQIISFTPHENVCLLTLVIIYYLCFEDDDIGSKELNNFTNLLQSKIKRT